MSGLSVGSNCHIFYLEAYNKRYKISAIILESCKFPVKLCLSNELRRFVFFDAILLLMLGLYFAGVSKSGLMWKCIVI